MILDGKTVVVSGVGPGLGREIATVARREGASVMLGARRADRVAAVAAEVDPTGERVAWQQTDITDDADARGLVAATVERFGRLDALVNCAAMDGAFGGLQDADFEEWGRTFDTNVIGTLQVCRAAAEHLKAEGGAIVFIGAQAMYWPQIIQAAYAASKAALTTAMYYLARELGPHRIRVNTVVPSWMWGPPVEGYVNSVAATRGITADEVLAGITANMPLGEMTADGDVAELVAFFCSDRARMITGQSLLINGGEFYH